MLAVQQDMVLHESIPVIPGFFHITYTFESRCCFWNPGKSAVVLLVIALVLFLLYGLFRKQLPANPWVYGGAGLLLGGALGNALDRTFRGAVTDFFDFRIWPVFNVADIGIVVGVVLLLWYSWTHISDK